MSAVVNGPQVSQLILATGIENLNNEIDLLIMQIFWKNPNYLYPPPTTNHEVQVGNHLPSHLERLMGQAIFWRTRLETLLRYEDEETEYITSLNRQRLT